MANPPAFFNTGLPQLPINTDPKIEPDLRDVFNAIRNLANGIGQYGGFEAGYDGYKSAAQAAYTAGPYKRRVYCEALEDITYGNTVHFTDTAGVLTAELADATTGLPCLGICNTVGTSLAGSTIEVVLGGCYVTSIGSLTPGTIYYQNTIPGTIVSAAPATNIQPLGFALTASIFYFFPCCMEAAGGGGGGTGDVVGPAASGNGNVVLFDGVTGKLIKDSGLTLSGTNTGDQTSIVGITGTLAQFNTALTGADFATGGGTVTGASSGTNTGDQTSIVGITGTKAQFDTACTDGNFLYVGDVTQYTDEMAQDATGAMVGTSIVYNDVAATLQRAALTGHVVAAQDSNALTLGSFTKAQLSTAVSDGDPLYVGDVTQYTDEMAQDAIGAMVTDGTLVYVDATPILKRAPITGHITIADGSNAAALGSFTSAQLDAAISDTNGVYQNQLAAGVATFLGTPSSANLLAATTDETGTGVLVFNTDPVMVRPSMSNPILASPRISSGSFFFVQPAPASKAAAATLTNLELLDGLIQYTGAAANLTLPTGTLMDTGALTLLPALTLNLAFDFYIINTSAATVTLVAGATFTIVGTAAILTGISAHWRARRTAANTWVAYRI